MRKSGAQGWYRLLAVITVLFFHVTTAMLVFYLSLFRTGFMIRESEKYQVQYRLNITTEELRQVTEEMISYVRGHNGNLDVTVTEDGSSDAFFTDRDKMHLEDIAVMVQQGKILCTIGLGLTALGIFFLCKQGSLSVLCKTYLVFWLVLIGVAVVLGIWIASDLQGFINGFHRMFFKNDLWVLNPATDRLIWLFPTRIFQDGAIIWGVWLAGVHIVVTTVTVLFSRFCAH